MTESRINFSQINVKCFYKLKDVNNKCDLCEEQLSKDESVLIGNCGHVFHKECINNDKKCVYDKHGHKLSGKKYCPLDNLEWVEKSSFSFPCA
jgi:hypothetical protein